jgi:hypothetical protein
VRRRALAAALVLVALVALALGRGRTPSPGPRPVDRPAVPPAAADVSARPIDPASLRDVFRFADEPLPRAHPESGAALRESAREPVPAKAPAGPRLVGLVRRAGRLVAAFAADGEVVLAGPGETAGGVTVISVNEDGVRIRRADGSEDTLVLD